MNPWFMVLMDQAFSTTEKGTGPSTVILKICLDVVEAREEKRKRIRAPFIQLLNIFLQNVLPIFPSLVVKYFKIFKLSSISFLILIYKLAVTHPNVGV